MLGLVQTILPLSRIARHSSYATATAFANRAFLSSGRVKPDQDYDKKLGKMSLPELVEESSCQSKRAANGEEDAQIKLTQCLAVIDQLKTGEPPYYFGCDGPSF